MYCIYIVPTPSSEYLALSLAVGPIVEEYVTWKNSVYIIDSVRSRIGSPPPSSATWCCPAPQEEKLGLE